MPVETDTYQPDEIWTPRAHDFELDPAIETARTEMNSKNPERLIHELQHQVKRSDNGIVYAVLKGNKPEEYSDTDALVIFNPFANTATANMLVRSEFIREVAKQADVRDEAGKLKTVVMLASPGLHGSRLTLSRTEKRQIKSGDLGPAAREYLQAVTALSYGRVALLGASQGADLAISGSESKTTVNLDRIALAAAEPAGVKDRSLLHLGRDFMRAGPDIGQRAKDSGLAALDMAHDEIRSDHRNFWASMAYPANWNGLARGMTGNSFEAKMQSIIEDGSVDKIIVGYGDRSTITPAEYIEPSLATLHKKVDKDLLLTVKVKGGTHAWTEELTVLAKLYLKALV